MLSSMLLMEIPERLLVEALITDPKIYPKLFTEGEFRDKTWSPDEILQRLDDKTENNIELRLELLNRLLCHTNFSSLRYEND